MSNLDSILAAAQAKAADLSTSTALTAGAPAAGAPAAGVPAATGTPFNMSMDAFLNAGGMECDSYVQVKDAGIKLNKDWGGYVDEFVAELDMRDVQFFMGIRKEVGSKVDYAKSYDGVTTSRGENFLQVVEDFRRTSSKPAEPYRGADIPLTLVEDVADPKKTGKTYTAGQVVGLTTSITGFKPFASFAKKLAQAGLGQARLKVKVTHSPRRNAAGQDYGVCEFDVVEVLDQPDSIAA